MKLTPDEYQRGLIFWSIDSPARIRTRVAATPLARERWSIPLLNPSGSLVRGNPSPFARHIRAEVLDPTALQRPFQVRWEAVVRDRLETSVWDDRSGSEVTLLEHVPNFGRFHRLVVQTPQLEFGRGEVLRVGDMVVRLIDGVVVGDKMEPATQTQVSEIEIKIEGGPLREHRELGRFIEIIVPGGTPEQAELRAYAVLGLLATLLSDHAVGEVLFSEAHQNDRIAGGTTVSETYGLIPWAVTEKAVDSMESGLLQINRGDETREALELALRWYEHGARAHTSVDQFLSYFVGIEGALKTLTKPLGTPEATQERRTRYRALKKLVSKELDEASLEDLSRAIQRPPDLRDLFSLYRKHRGWLADLDDLFRDLASRRNDVFHGSSTLVTERQALEAKQLLGRIVRSELGLPEALDWERVPLRFPLLTEGRTMMATPKPI